MKARKVSEMSQDDPYRTLGVPRDATPGEIRAAFRAAVRGRHPDTAPGGTDSAGVRSLIEAYRLLMDPIARDRLDTQPSSSAGSYSGSRGSARSRSMRFTRFRRLIARRASFSA